MLNLVPDVKFIEISDGSFSPNHIQLGESLLSEQAKNDFLGFCNMPGGDENILFRACGNMGDEEYEIFVSDKILISAGGAPGQLYALQTLKQIFFQTNFTVPHLHIKDKPEYKIRGFMLDVGRYFFSVSDVKLIIKRMALHKLNLLHLHLTEDQGWRVEISAYPLLTEKGSMRKRTNYNFKAHGGFYTKAEIKELVDYAHAFSVKVMPEFDIPGHSRAAIACYRELACFERNLPVADHWGVKHDVLCAGKESTMIFVKNVLNEFFEMFPDKYIHIGGDEVPKHRWNLCPHCQSKIKELKLNDSDELQAWFMNEINSYCTQNGRQAFMWCWDIKNQDILDSSLGFTKCCGSSIDTSGRPFIDTSSSAYYIDLPYGNVSLKASADHKVYNGNCLGVEATLWSEYVPDMARADFMTYPRLGAICSTAWSGVSSYSSFEQRLDFYYSFLDKCRISYAPLKTANPSRVKGFFQSLWFERRQLTWQGISNIFDDKHIEHIAKKQLL